MDQVTTQFRQNHFFGEMLFFFNTTTILLACIRSLKSSTKMNIHKRMFFARRDTFCNDTTELSVVQFHNMLSAAFVVPALNHRNQGNL